MIAANSFVRLSARCPTQSAIQKPSMCRSQNCIQAVKKHQLEGIVSKRADSPYRSGERSEDWLKWRATRGQEFVIGGYIPNGDTLDSILVG